MKASFLYVVIIKISNIRPYCQGMLSEIIDACEENFIAPSNDPMDILSLLGSPYFNLWWR